MAIEPFSAARELEFQLWPLGGTINGEEFPELKVCSGYLFKCGNRKETLNFASECGLKCKGGRAKTNLSWLIIAPNNLYPSENCPKSCGLCGGGSPAGDFGNDNVWPNIHGNRHPGNVVHGVPMGTLKHWLKLNHKKQQENISWYSLGNGYLLWFSRFYWYPFERLLEALNDEILHFIMLILVVYSLPINLKISCAHMNTVRGINCEVNKRHLFCFYEWGVKGYHHCR